MKIQFFGERTFLLEGKKNTTYFNPKADEKADVALYSKPTFEAPKASGAGKVLSLPGEFEVAGALITGLPSDNKQNIVFKVDVDDIVFAHMGDMTELPLGKFYDELGENVDVLLLPLSSELNAKQAKEVIEKVSPRMAFLCGDKSLFPEAREKCGAKVAEESTKKLSRSQFSDDATEVIILSAE